jgi:hypothetical protein
MANLTGKATVEGEGDSQLQEFNFKLKKVDRTWLVYRIDTVKTLSQTTALRSAATISCPSRIAARSAVNSRSMIGATCRSALGRDRCRHRRS